MCHGTLLSAFFAFLLYVPAIEEVPNPSGSYRDPTRSRLLPSAKVLNSSSAWDTRNRNSVQSLLLVFQSPLIAGHCERTWVAALTTFSTLRSAGPENPTCPNWLRLREFSVSFLAVFQPACSKSCLTD